jgi:enamine deaminase RidA (YjgF/YER057c/UK114 family)
MERYRQFNSARRSALIASGRDLTGNVPAACALGSVNGSPLVIYFLASRKAPALIENPRQVSAYEYPPEYGPKPAFSRASVLREPSGSILFISGTASIVGHQTVHPGDVAAQTRETLINIEALLGEANRVSGAPRFGMETLACKVYVRNSADLPLIQSQLHTALGREAQVVYLQADICRQDLLVEIEAIGRERDCD